MDIYAIGDLHLGTSVDKPMNKFGFHWDNHWDKICENWKSRVKNDDIVLIPGDISWAVGLVDAYYDLYKISKLPGIKVFCKGNHDFWWKSLKKINRLALDKMFFIQNNSFLSEGYAFCGTRGWINPKNSAYKDRDNKLYKRELSRLKLSLESVKPDGLKKIVLLHFPPFGDKGDLTEFNRVLEENGAAICVYGHLHNAQHITQGRINGIEYHMVSCDFLDFKVKRITQD